MGKASYLADSVDQSIGQKAVTGVNLRGEEFDLRSSEVFECYKGVLSHHKQSKDYLCMVLKRHLLKTKNGYLKNSEYLTLLVAKASSVGFCTIASVMRLSVRIVSQQLVGHY